VAGIDDEAVLGSLVTEADRVSVERDLRENRIDPAATSLGVPVDRYLLDAMRSLARGGRWQINVPGARLWMLAEGLQLVWPSGAEDMVALLAADRVPGIPRDPETLADILLEWGLAVPRQEGDQARRYWRLAPAPLARDGQVVTFFVVGTTGAGKTRLFDLLVTQAVLRGKAVVIIDPKGDQDLRNAAERACRSLNAPERFVHFHPTFPRESARIAPLHSFNHATEVASRVAALIPSETGNDPFKAIGSILVADLAAVAGDRYTTTTGVNLTPVNVFIDEAAEVVNDPFIQLLNKGRGAGLRLTVATPRPSPISPPAPAARPSPVRSSATSTTW